VPLNTINLNQPEITRTDANEYVFTENVELIN
jgi:hypothetical protein